MKKRNKEILMTSTSKSPPRGALCDQFRKNEQEVIILALKGYRKADFNLRN